jgi:hypothetical protein
MTLSLTTWFLRSQFLAFLQNKADNTSYRTPGEKPKSDFLAVNKTHVCSHEQTPHLRRTQ